MEVRNVIEDAHETPIMCTAYNRARNELYSGGQDTLIKVWEAETGKYVRTQSHHKGWVTDMLYSTQINALFSASVDSTILVWSDKGKLLQVVEFGGPVFCLAWNQKREPVLIAGGDQVIQLYTVASHEELNSANRTFAGDEGLKVLRPGSTATKAHGDLIRGICCTETGRIFSVGYDRCICIYQYDSHTDSDRTTPKLKLENRKSNCHDGAICSVAFDTDNNWLITGSYDGKVKLWSQEGNCLDTFEGMSDTVTGLCYVPATRNYWITGKSRRLVVYDPKTPLDITPYIKETGKFGDYGIHKIFQPPGTDLVVGISAQRQLVIWRYNPSAAFRVLNGHSDWVETICLSNRKDEPKHSQLFSAGSDGLILRWQPSSELNTDLYVCMEEMSGHEGNILCMVFSPELDMLITGGEDRTIRLWHLDGRLVGNPGEEGEEPEVNVLFGHEGRVTGLACCSEYMLASISHDMSIRYWDLHTKQRHVIKVVDRAHDSPLQCIEYCDAREELATCAAETRVKIWCAFNHTLKTTLTGHTGVVTQCKWVPFKMAWVTAADDESIRLWSGDGQQLFAFTFRSDSVTAMFVDAANKLLLAAMTDRAIRVFDLMTVEENPLPVRKYNGHTDMVRGIVYVAEKGQYVTASWDKTLRVWRSPVHGAKKGGAGLALRRSLQGGGQEAPEEEPFVSSYEKEHPLVMPKALRGNQTTMLKLVTKAGGKASKGAGAGVVAEEREVESRTGLGRMLQELESRLKTEHFPSERRRGGASPKAGRRARPKARVQG